MSKFIKRSLGLDLARALAICMVLISHFGHKNFDAIGFWGVELFFALSGFLIGQILWRNFSESKQWSIASITNFWSRRWWRTLPNYYLFFVLMLLFVYFNGTGVPTLSQLSYYLWFGQNLFSGKFGFYTVAWSLCIEEWFYLLFPIMLFILNKISLKGKFAYALALFVLFTASLTMRYTLMHSNGGDTLRTTTFARLDAIGCGVLIAFIMALAKPGIIIKRVMFFVGLLLVVSPLIVGKLYAKDMDILKQDPLVLLFVPLGFALILPLLSLLQNFSGIFSVINVCIEKLSLWSYSIYLSHIPIMWIAYYVMSKQRDTTLGNLASKILGLLFTILAAAVIYKYYEVPFTRKRPAEIK